MKPGTKELPLLSMRYFEEFKKLVSGARSLLSTRRQNQRGLYM